MCVCVCVFGYDGSSLMHLGFLRSCSSLWCLGVSLQEASLVVEPGPWDEQTSVAVAHGLSSCGAWS